MRTVRMRTIHGVENAGAWSAEELQVRVITLASVTGEKGYIPVYLPDIKDMAVRMNALEAASSSFNIST